jgi:hypothetical protein
MAVVIDWSVSTRMHEGRKRVLLIGASLLAALAGTI